jgi:hypothetical protein
MILREPSPVTIATLDKLDSVEWFQNVGQKDNEFVEYVGTWKAAIKSCSSTAWENFTLEAANNLRVRILKVAPERFKLWNEVIDIVKPFSQALVQDKISGILAAENLPKAVSDCVEWDILHLCVEAEYSDVVEPGFFSSLSYHYYTGHFPCGYKGKIPNGKIVVY